MNTQTFTIRNAAPREFTAIGQLLVDVYSGLEGFPKPSEQPRYYEMLANVGNLTLQPDTEIIVAAGEEDQLLGAVVFFTDMKNYGSGGTATQEKNAAGFRLLGVRPAERGLGIGKLLTQECIRRAREHGKRQVIIHTTMAMQRAWKMYESLGFQRSDDLDFLQGQLPVFGFRMILEQAG